MTSLFAQDASPLVNSFIKSVVDIVDDSAYCNFPTTSKNRPFLNFLTETPRQSEPPGLFMNPSIQSCPVVHKPIFTFNEVAPHKNSIENSPPSTNSQAAPTVKLQITGNPNYQLDECDILSIISEYGSILNIELAGPRTAFIAFDDVNNALSAQRALNGQYINHLGIKLYLSYKEASPKPKGTTSTAYVKSFTNIDEEYHPTTSNATQSLSNLDSIEPVFQFTSNKLTCKYEVQIEYDQDFKIARKIIGPRGCNMKKILDICQQQGRRSNILFQNDTLKLRLRGTGSGFKEGPEQKESDEVLHLCVSSKHAQIYDLACKLVEELLRGLYTEYHTFCQRMGRPLEAPVQIKKMKSAEEKSNEVRTNSRKNSMEENVKELKASEASTSESGSLDNSVCSGSEKDVKSSPGSQWRRVNH